MRGPWVGGGCHGPPGNPSSLEGLDSGLVSAYTHMFVSGVLLWLSLCVSGQGPYPRATCMVDRALRD